MRLPLVTLIFVGDVQPAVCPIVCATHAKASALRVIRPIGTPVVKLEFKMAVPSGYAVEEVREPDRPPIRVSPLPIRSFPMCKTRFLFGVRLGTRHIPISPPYPSFLMGLLL
jgi:hypothetical protein